MKRTEYFKIGIALLLVSIIFGALPAVALMLRNASGDPDLAEVDATQQSTDMGGALSFLSIMVPVAVVGVVMIVLGARKVDN